MSARDDITTEQFMLFEEFLEHYDGARAEWMDGKVVLMSPVSIRHEKIRKFLLLLLEAYFALTKNGQIYGEPVVMRLASQNSAREPDLFVVLKGNIVPVHASYIDGPADIVIEIVSEATGGTDYGEKFLEYEAGGVGEYWIVDPLRQRVRISRRGEDDQFFTILDGSEGEYTTPALPKFTLDVALLWRDELPSFYEIGDMARRMMTQ
jgi:Uma2 family endonuclease